MRTHLLLLVLLQHWPLGAPLEMEILRGKTRCVAEDMSEDALGKFTFQVLPDDSSDAAKKGRPSSVSVNVKGPESDRDVHYKKRLTDEEESYEFTSHTVGLYTICFSNQGKSDTRVRLQVQTDLAVKDYKKVVQAEHLRPLELLFVRAEDKLQSISTEMSRSRDREAQLRETSMETANRIQWFSILSITVLLTISAWQMFYLKNYFRSKKLL